MRKTFKIGDFVGFVFGMPGPDITQAVVIEAGNEIKCYDPWFDIEFKTKPKFLWHLTERELECKVSNPKFGTVIIREKLEEVKQERCKIPKTQFGAPYVFRKSFMTKNTRGGVICAEIDENEQNTEHFSDFFFTGEDGTTPLSTKEIKDGDFLETSKEYSIWVEGIVGEKPNRKFRFFIQVNVDCLKGFVYYGGKYQRMRPSNRCLVKRLPRVSNQAKHKMKRAKNDFK